MTTSAPSTCNACAYWVPPPPPLAPTAGGQCRRYPPSGAPQNVVSGWPLVFGTDWCGDFTAASVAHETTATYTWNGNSPPPVSGEFRSSTRSWNANSLVFWPTDANAQNLVAVFGAIASGDSIRAQQVSNANNWHMWSASGAATQNADTTWTLPVTNASSGGQAASAAPCTLTFTLAA